MLPTREYFNIQGSLLRGLHPKLPVWLHITALELCCPVVTAMPIQADPPPNSAPARTMDRLWLLNLQHPGQAKKVAGVVRAERLKPSFTARTCYIQKTRFCHWPHIYSVCSNIEKDYTLHCFINSPILYEHTKKEKHVWFWMYPFFKAP